MILLPQIPKFIAADLADLRGRMSIPEARVARALDHPLKVFSPTGGSHFTDGGLDRLRTQVEEIARHHGYPGVRPSDWAAFDHESAELLHRVLRISFNEASKPGPWQFLACVLMPDIVIWRQRRAEGAIVKADNFLDSTNNLFRRLWWRAAIFHDPHRLVDPLWLLDHLLEDAIQTFFERRSLSGTPRMGLVFGRVYHAAAQLLPPRFNMEPVERTAQKWLVRIGENVAFDSLDDEALVNVVAEAFQLSLPETHRTAIQADMLVERAALPIPPAPAPAASPADAAPMGASATPFGHQRADAFTDAMLRRFEADRGTYSTVTPREADASEINLTGPEARIVEAFYGRERIHVGPVRTNPENARQRFRAYPSGELIYLNLVYPKHDRSEMRLYLSVQKGFKPPGGAIWFLFQKKRDLFIGYMSQDEWNKHLSKQP